MLRSFLPPRAGKLVSYASAMVGVCVFLAACGAHGLTVPAVPSGPLTLQSRLGGEPDSAAGKIKHIVVIVQENRSFDGLFHGFKGADYATSGKDHTGKTITLTAVSFKANYELCHNFADANADVNGGAMDGFDVGGPNCHVIGQPPANPAYKYVSTSETTHYFTMAKQYSLADEFFSSQLDGSYVAHQYLIASQAGWAINTPNGFPWGCDAPPNTRVQLINSNGQETKTVFPCFSYATLGQQLDTKGISWSYYTPPSSDPGYLWAAYNAIKYICNPHNQKCGGTEWNSHVVTNQCQVITDAQAGNLPTVTWVIPDLADSDHPQSNSTSGPKWVTQIVNAIGGSSLWSTTAIFVTWDDWGGFYDHVAPPTKAATGFAPDVDGPGMRVPLVAISPYTKAGTLTHKKYDGFAAILKTIEGLNGLTAMTARDKAATSLFSDTSIFDFNQTPRTFTHLTNTGYTCNPADSRPNDSDYGVPASQDG